VSVGKTDSKRRTGYSRRVPLFQAPFTGARTTGYARRGSLGYFEVLSVFEARSMTKDKCTRLG